MPGKKRGTPVPTKEQLIGKDGLGSEPFVRYLSDMQKGYESLAEHIDKLLPIGIIQMFAGAFKDIPNGWYLCDGNNGTPDLSDKFLYCTNEETEIGDIGGSKVPALLDHTHAIDHTHDDQYTEEDGEHRHQYDTLPPYNDYFSSGSGYQMIDNRFSTYNTSYAGDHKHQIKFKAFTGDSGNASDGDQSEGNLPPYYKVAYIMRME